MCRRSRCHRPARRPDPSAGQLPDTELKTMLGELAKINRSRIERMLGPEGGYLDY
ncbi:hypothetical protein BTZ20_5330 [Rhodococcus sp. MTM3W5.2]|nr:hypothetical protein BTZ20_5330 [Rhodococcus sp. MTM3W5.2]